jgi:hypothetical protein
MDPTIDPSTDPHDDASALVAQDYASATVDLPYAVQQGIAPPPATLAANLTADVTAYCKNFADRCPNGVPTGDIAADVAAYTAALGGQVAVVQTQAVALPLTPQAYSALYGNYYSPSTGFAAPTGVMPTEPVPTSPAFTSPSNVQATSQETPAAGTAGGIGPTQGGANTQQSTLAPSPAAAGNVAAAAPGATWFGVQPIIIILAGVLILVLLANK